MKVKLILGLLVLAAIIATVVIMTSQPSYYKQVVLSDDNLVVNNTTAAYYDTVLKVGLDEMEIGGTVIVINDLPEAAKGQAGDGELQAHVRYYDDAFYLFIKDLNHGECIRVLAHEIIHIKQYKSGELTYDMKTEALTWLGKPYTLQTGYEDRPWEADAYKKEAALADSISKKLSL